MMKMEKGKINKEKKILKEQKDRKKKEKELQKLKKKDKNLKSILEWMHIQKADNYEFICKIRILKKL